VSSVDGRKGKGKEGNEKKERIAVEYKLVNLRGEDRSYPI
jgi:hypothetical protein